MRRQSEGSEEEFVAMERAGMAGGGARAVPGREGVREWGRQGEGGSAQRGEERQPRRTLQDPQHRRQRGW